MLEEASVVPCYIAGLFTGAKGVRRLTYIPKGANMATCNNILRCTSISPIFRSLHM